MARKLGFKLREYTETHASCSKCNTMQPLDNFHLCKSQPKGITYWCKDCANSSTRKHNDNNKDNPEYKDRKRSSHFKRLYGLTLIEYQEKLKAQNYECAICKVELPTGGSLTHLDHCHTTGKIRAFLCTNCNRGLGHFKDSIKNLSVAIDYLKSHNSSVD
jgi:hypothetical protein